MDSPAELIVLFVNMLAMRALYFLNYDFVTLLGVPFISALAVLQFARLEFKLGRASYFCATGLFILLFAVGNSLLFLIDMPLPSGTFPWESAFFSVGVLAIYAWFVATGVFLGFASSARAMDAYGHRTYWFLGFIPIANLVLLLKRPRERKRLSLNRLAGNTLLIVIGALLIWAVRLQSYILYMAAGVMGR